MSNKMCTEGAKESRPKAAVYSVLGLKRPDFCLQFKDLHLERFDLSADVFAGVDAEFPHRFKVLAEKLPLKRAEDGAY